MDFGLRLLAASVGVVFLGLVLSSIRSSSMRPSLAWMWLGIGTFLVSVGVVSPFYRWVSVSVIGIEDARTLVYVALIGFLLVYNFRMTVVMSRALDRIQELITHTAILEAKVEDLQPPR